MTFDFTVRIYKPESNSCLNDISFIDISGITIVSKPNKFDGICEHKANQKKYKYTFSTKNKFLRVSGTNSYPTLNFRGQYIDIDVKNFPRYPAFMQCNMSEKLIINDNYSGNDNGFPTYLEYRKIEIILK